VNVLFVCLGNICRSPLAEGIMRRLYEEKKIEGIVASAATSNWNDGLSADHRSVKVASQHGIDLSRHVSRQIKTEDFHHFEAIYAMDSQNERDLRAIAPKHLKDKIRRLKDVSGRVVDVKDPYYGGDQDFLEVFQVLENCLKQEDILTY
jgi:protein-tyrosine phosphatase